MNRLLTLLLLVVSQLMYAVNYGVSPASTSPNEHHSDKKATSNKSHKKTKHFHLFKHKKHVRKSKRHLNAPQNQTRSWAEDCMSEWFALVLISLLVAISITMIAAGLILSITWLGLVGFLVYFLTGIGCSLEDGLIIFFVASGIVIIIGALVLALILNITWLAIMMYVIIGLLVLLGAFILLLFHLLG